MSLLQNEDFIIYQLRTAYLANIHDGVGERLINVNSTFLNDPAFRAAGWQANAKDIKRTYSPPIPTASSAQYFKLPPQDGGRATPANGDEEEEGGMVTGQGREELLGGPALIAKRRKRKEQLQEDDDSSDLSDESDDETEAADRPATKIQFTKMPNRERAGSSPIRNSSKQDKQPSLMVTSPSRPPDGSRLRHGSLGASETTKTRPRRDTTTSSEMSSENDFDSSLFTRKPINSSARNLADLHGSINEDDEEDEEATAEEDAGQTVDEDSDDSSLASGFSEEEGEEGEDGGASILQEVPTRLDSSSLASIQMARPPDSRDTSPKRSKPAPDVLQDLPPPRPISTVQPVSALGLAIRARNKKAASPFEKFATLSGIGDPGPLCIKLYVPSSSNPVTPLEIFLKRTSPTGNSVSVAEAIGFGLWRYCEEKLSPVITGSKFNVNAWMLWMVDDGEVDIDFPPLERLKPITDLTSNNNRARPRMRQRPWDEFALVEATPEQFEDNEKITPQYSDDAREARESSKMTEDARLSATPAPDSVSPQSSPEKVLAGEQPPGPTTRIRESVNPITNPRIITAPFRRDTNPNSALDLPAAPESYATPRTGASKTLNIHFTSSTLTPQVMQLETTTDTYLSEVFDQVCKRLNLDKALFVLRITGTSLVAPADRTVEALGSDRNSLDLARRRFVGEGGVGLSGSPGSSSPNAPIMLPGASGSPSAPAGGSGPGTPSRKERVKLTRQEREARRREKKRDGAHPLAQATNTASDLWNGGDGTKNPLVPLASGTNYRRYHVLRKTAMSFSSQHPRVLVLDGEYLHIMAGGDIASGLPAHPSHVMELESGRTPGKTTTIHFSSVVGCKVSRKHRKMFRVVVFKERETKRYDFEAGSPQEASEIVEEIHKGVEPFRGGN